MKTVQIPLTLEQVDQVLSIVVKRPYEEVYQLVETIRFNTEKQLAETSEAKKEVEQ